MNISLKPNYQELIFNDKDYEDVFSESFFYSPETFDEEDLGHLFLVGKIKSKVEKRQGPIFLLNYIASKLSQNYYSYVNYKIRDALSNSLQIVNRLIKDLYYKKEIDWLQDMFLLAGVIYKNKIYFSILNKATILLCRQGKIQDLQRQQFSLNKEEGHFFDSVFKADVMVDDKILVITPLEHQSEWKVDYFNNVNLLKQEAISLANRSFAALLIFFAKPFESEPIIQPKTAVEPEPSKTKLELRKSRAVLTYMTKLIGRLKSVKFTFNIKFNLKAILSKLLIPVAIVGFLLIAVVAILEAQKNRSIRRDLDKAKGYIEAFYSFDYKDVEERRRFLNEARVILEKYNLPHTREELQHIQFLLKNLNFIRFFSKINIISLDKLTFAPTKIIGQGRTLLLTDGQNVGIVDLLREQVENTQNLFNQKLDPKLVQPLKDKIYALLPHLKKLLIYDLKIKSISEADINLPSSDIIAIQLYQDFIYALSRAGLLYKYAHSNLSKYNEWFKKNPNFQNVLNFGIDGRIYILDSTKIYRFLKGNLELDNVLQDYKIKDFRMTADKFDFFIAWSDNVLFFISKKDLQIQKVIISPKINKIQDVILDDNSTFYILQDKEIITAFID